MGGTEAINRSIAAVSRKSRTTRECQIRFCEGLGVKFPRSTRLPKQRTYAFYPAEFKELTRLRLKESSPWESHPQALAEPYVNLSAHTAPITQAADRKPSRQCANSPGSRLATRPSQALAQDSLRLNRLYFLIAHRTR